MSAAVAAPISDMMRISSSSSKNSSSTLVKEWMTVSTCFIIASLVFFKPSLILSKNPIRTPPYWDCCSIWAILAAASLTLSSSSRETPCSCMVTP